MPWRAGFGRAYAPFAANGLHHDVVFGGSGKLGFPANALLAVAMGADMIGVAREPMLAIGCIQALRCHDGHCPTGVTTHNKWLTRGLDPTDKATRLANYITGLRGEMLKLAHACGVVHPALVTSDMIEFFDEPQRSTTATARYGLNAEIECLSDAQRQSIEAEMRDLARNTVTH